MASVPNSVLLLLLALHFSPIFAHLRENQTSRDHPRHLHCADHDYLRTLKWQPPELSQERNLLYYNISSCAPASCRYAAIHCYDNKRNEMLRSTNETICRLSGSVPLYSATAYRVVAVFKGIRNDSAGISKVERVCNPIDYATSISPPKLVLIATKNSITANLLLPTAIKNNPDIAKKYNFCLIDDATPNCSTTLDTGCCKMNTLHSDDMNDYKKYPSLAPSTAYKVMGWYDTTTYDKRSKQSDFVLEEITTERDPFPISTQIEVIILLCILAIIAIFSGLGARYFVHKRNDSNAFIHSKLPKYLDDMMNKMQIDENADPNTVPSDILLQSNFWELLQSKHYEPEQEQCAVQLKLRQDQESSDGAVEEHHTAGGSSVTHCLGTQEEEAIEDDNDFDELQGIQVVNSGDFFESNSVIPVAERGDYATRRLNGSSVGCDRLPNYIREHGVVVLAGDYATRNSREDNEFNPSSSEHAPFLPRTNTGGYSPKNHNTNNNKGAGNL